MTYEDYQIGDELNVELTGIQDYGVFAQLDDETQGLIHISEIEHFYIESDLTKIFTVGEELKVKILDIDEYDGRISLSLRALKEAHTHPFSNRKNNPRYGRKTGSAFKYLGKRLPGWIAREFKKQNNPAAISRLNK